METSLYTRFPDYRHYHPLFEGDWRASWVELMDELNTTLERQYGWVSREALRCMDAKVARLGVQLSLTT